MTERKTEMDMEELLQLGEQMVSFVQERASSWTAFLDEVNADLFGISLTCEEDHVELLTRIEDLEKKVAKVEHDLREAHFRDQSGASKDDLQNHRDELLHRESSLKGEERSLQNMLEELSKQRETLQSQKESLKKLDAEMQRNQMAMALCASTFHLIPSDEGNNRVAGNFVDSKGRVVDTFGFDTEGMDDFKACEKLWNLVAKR